MSRLLAVSFDAASSPAVTLKALEPARSAHERYGWGIAWYPDREHSAVVMKDPAARNDSVCQLLHDWDRFRTPLLIAHLRGAAKRVSQEDTHPFVRSYAGRHWVFTHNGELDHGFRQELPLGDAPIAECVGHTDSEHILCWIVARLHERGARSLADLGFEALREYLLRINELGTLNVLLSDGKDLVAYQDRNGFNPLHWRRRRPPHKEWRLESEDVSIDFDAATDVSRTALVISTDPLSSDPWTAMRPSQLIAVRRGVVAWDSEGVATEILKKQATRVRVGRPSPPPAVIQQSEAAPAGTPPPTPSVETRLYRVIHVSRYVYESAIEKSEHLLRLRPVSDRYQEVLSYDLEISPSGLRQEYEDVFGNEVTRLHIDAPFTEMNIASTSLVRVRSSPQEALHISPRRSTIPLVWMPWQRQMMLPYLLPPELPEGQLNELFDYAMSFVERQDYDLEETIIDMNQSIYRDYAYVPGATTVETTPFEVYSSRRGVCQDFANLIICLARLIEVPARYRVGYIYTGANYENKLQSDASHAWAELYLPSRGWGGLDPTNGCLVGSDHVRVAAGRNYRDATPTSGTIYRGGGAETLTIDVRVTPVEEAL